MNTVAHHISIAEIIALAAEQARCHISDIKGPRRIKPLVRVRFRAMAVARMIRQDKSLTVIGHAFGRDHSTVINALATHYERVHADPAEALATEALWRAAMLECFKRQIAACEQVLRVQREQAAALDRASALAARMTAEAAGLVQ